LITNLNLIASPAKPANWPASWGAVRDLDVLIEMFCSRAQQPGLTEAEAAALDYLTKHCLKRRDKRHKQLIEYLERLDQQQFESEFQRFFTFNHDSNLSIATTG